MTPRRAPARFYTWLVLFGLVNGVGVNLLLMHCSGSDPAVRSQSALPTTLQYTRDFALQRSSFDSWRPMREALAILEDEPEQSVYQTLFFDRQIKFQYAPTSLLLLEPLDDLSNRALNRISWVAVLGAALLTGAIFAVSRRGLLVPSAPDPWRLRFFHLALGLGFALTFFPLLRAYRLGQIQTWIDVLFCGALLCWMLGRSAASGALSGLICVIKPQLGLLVVWALLRRHTRFAVAWCGVVGLAGVVSLGAYGWENHWDYLSVLSYIAQHGESYRGNQSLGGLLHRAFFNGENLAFQPNRFAPYHPLVVAGSTLGAVGLIGFALFFRPPSRSSRSPGAPARPGPEATIDFLIAALSFTIAAPIVWEHHYGITLPMFAVALPILAARGPKQVSGWVALAVAYALLSNKFDFVHATAATHWNVVQSTYLFGGILLMGQLYRLRGQFRGRTRVS